MKLATTKIPMNRLTNRKMIGILLTRPQDRSVDPGLDKGLGGDMVVKATHDGYRLVRGLAAVSVETVHESSCPLLKRRLAISPPGSPHDRLPAIEDLRITPFLAVLTMKI
jgi:hypothetical protein